MPDIAHLRWNAQRIARPAAQTPEAIVTQLGAIQAQDYPGALWSIGLRIAGATRADVERAIANRTITRTWPMRGTLHFVPAVDARWMLQLMAPRIMKSAEGRHRQLELDDAAFRRSRLLIAKALKRDPIATRSALFTALEVGGVPTTGQRGIHILQQLCMESTLCHGPHSEKQPTFTHSTNGSRPHASSIAKTHCARLPSGTSRATDRQRCVTSSGGRGSPSLMQRSVFTWHERHSSNSLLTTPSCG